MSLAEENLIPEVNLIQGRIEEVSLGEPTVYGQMAMFPLLDKEESAVDYLTLDESIANGYAYVTEIDEGGSVPELKEKDVVLINKNIKEVSLGGGIYAIKWKGNIQVKRLQVNPQAGTVLIKSDNPSYETLETNLDDIEIEGKIIWFGREIR